MSVWRCKLEHTSEEFFDALAFDELEAEEIQRSGFDMSEPEPALLKVEDCSIEDFDAALDAALHRAKG